MRKSLRPKWRDSCALFASLLGSGSSFPSGAARYCVLPWNAKSVGALNRLGLYHAQDRSLFLTDFLRPRFVRGRERAISDGRYPRHGRAYDGDSKLSPHDRDEQANPQRLPTVSAGRQPSTKSSADLSISLSTSAALQIAAALSSSWLPRRSFSCCVGAGSGRRGYIAVLPHAVLEIGLSIAAHRNGSGAFVGIQRVGVAKASLGNLRGWCGVHRCEAHGDNSQRHQCQTRGSSRP